MWLERFNDMRKNSGMSLDEISLKSGVPKSTLSKITAGITKSPPLETMRKLVYSMGYTLDDLDDCLRKTSPDVNELTNIYSQLNETGRKRLLSNARYLLTEDDCVDRPAVSKHA